MSKQQLLNVLIYNITMDETVSAVDNFIKCDKKAYCSDECGHDDKSRER